MPKKKTKPPAAVLMPSAARVITAADQVAVALDFYGPPAPDPEATMTRPRLPRPPNLAPLGKLAGDD
jgi:hypothetical protein